MSIDLSAKLKAILAEGDAIQMQMQQLGNRNNLLMGQMTCLLELDPSLRANVPLHVLNGLIQLGLQPATVPEKEPELVLAAVAEEKAELTPEVTPSEETPSI